MIMLKQIVLILAQTPLHFNVTDHEKSKLYNMLETGVGNSVVSCLYMSCVRAFNASDQQLFMHMFRTVWVALFNSFSLSFSISMCVN